MSVVVQDNFLDKNYFKEIQDEILGIENRIETYGYHFPWFMAPILLPSKDTMMIHMVYGNHNPGSPFYKKLLPLIDKLDVYSLLRIKINLQERKEKFIEGGMHIDMPTAPENALTSILYMNTNNGYTKLESGEKIASVENRLATFPNSLKHTGSTNTCEAPYRCVINIDWIKKENK